VIDYYFILDKDECNYTNHGCDANARCNNTMGSHTCNCNVGFNGNGTHCEGT
jgi:hypothetical protein